jgi:hypothetical protein
MTTTTTDHDDDDEGDGREFSCDLAALEQHLARLADQRVPPAHTAARGSATGRTLVFEPPPRSSAMNARPAVSTVRKVGSGVPVGRAVPVR